MSLLAECPQCHRKQSVKNRLCADCGGDLVKLKKNGKVKYWIVYRMPDGKQRKESIGYSIEEARDAEGKRRSQKRENRIFDMLPESKMTFKELAAWYLDLAPVKKLASCDRVELVLTNFNKVFGDRVINTIKPMELEEYQDKREADGLAPATIDMEISIVKTMVNKAFDNDMVDGRTVKAFRTLKRKLKKASNARKRTITVEEYQGLCDAAPPHLKAMLVMAYNTGMRLGEIRTLIWSYVDMEKGFIRLPEEATKEGRKKTIPINPYVAEVISSLPRALHHDFVFTFKGNPIESRGGIKKSFKTACKNAGISCGRAEEDGVTFHDIRRTVKTNMLNAGVDKVHRDVMLGHTLEGMDVHYLVPSEEDLKRAMELYTKWLDKQIEGATSHAQLG